MLTDMSACRCKVTMKRLTSLVWADRSSPSSVDFKIGLDQTVALGCPDTYLRQHRLTSLIDCRDVIT